ncbi:MAG: ORF6N domain-containing protein [Verrucomicrobiota bacterium]
MPAKKKAVKPATTSAELVADRLALLVHLLRGEKAILDSDLARLYGVETKALNQAVQRNQDRFPSDFMFQLSQDEMESLRSQFVTLKQGQHRKYPPYAFTEQGIAMLSSVLRSPRAVEVNIAIMRTFVQLRRLMDSNALLADKIEQLERKYANHDQQFQIVFEAIKKLITSPSKPSKELGFHTIASSVKGKQSSKRIQSSPKP